MGRNWIDIDECNVAYYTGSFGITCEKDRATSCFFIVRFGMYPLYWLHNIFRILRNKPFPEYAATSKLRI